MSETSGIVDELMSIKGGAEWIAYDAERDRFNMPHASQTRISDALNANRIVVDGNNIAIATQYPLPKQVEAHLQLLLDNSTPVLVVLASTTDIQNNLLPEYFSGAATYGSIETKSKFVDYIDLGKTIEAKVFNLTVTSSESSLEVPVIHVYNWPDHRTVNTETTTKLVELINTTMTDSLANLNSNNSASDNVTAQKLPVMHCKAGVGRTGQTLAAMVMNQNPSLSLETITKDLRASRNDRMIQTPHQMRTLVKLDSMRTNPTLESPKIKQKSGKSFFSKLFGR